MGREISQTCKPEVVRAKSPFKSFPSSAVPYFATVKREKGKGKSKANTNRRVRISI